MKKMLKRAVAVVLTTVIILCAAPLNGFIGLDLGFLNLSTKSSALASSGKCGENATWSFNSSTGTLTISGTGEIRDYHLNTSDDSPFESHNEIIKVVINNGITGIGFCAFYDCLNLSSISLPNSIVSLRSCFWDCKSLKSITIPASVNELKNPFSGCPLTNITVNSANKVYDSRNNCNAIIETANKKLIQGSANTIIPDGIVEIREYSFTELSIKSIIIPDSVNSIGEGAFSYCDYLTTVTLSNNLTEIEDYTFYKCSNLKSITIPNSVVNIGSESFCDCTNLTSIKIGKKVSSIGENAFSYCKNLLSLVVDINNTTYDSRNNCNALIETKTSSLIIGTSNSTIPNGILSIEDNAFSERSGLTKINIPASIKTIGDSAFSCCSGLTSLMINSVEDMSIGRFAFSGCTSLNSLVIPKGVKRIGSDAFYNCINLHEIEMIGDNTYVGDDAFRDTGYYNDESNWKDSVLYIGKYLIDVSDETINEYMINEGTVSIAEEAFITCENIKSCYVPESVNVIGNHAIGFYYMFGGAYLKNKDFTLYCIKGSAAEQYAAKNGLKCVIENETLNRCGENATWILDESTGILAIKGSGSLYSWNFYCSPFYNNNKIKQVIVDEGISSIGSSAFQECENLSKINLPESITEIGCGAFFRCSSLEEIVIPNKVTNIDDYTFEYCDSLRSVTLPEGVARIGYEAFDLCSSLSSINLPESLKIIDHFAFDDCLSLKSLTLPKGLTEIGDAAALGFYDNSPEYCPMDKKVPGFTIYCYNDTVGERYAIDNNLNYELLDQQISKHNITYNYSYNGGTSSTKTSAIVAEGSAIDLTPTAVKSGWTFVGWNTNSSAATGLTSLKMGSSDVTLYAIYKKTLTGTFIDYNGTNKTTRTASTTIYNKSTSGTISAPAQNTYSGWTKRGWSTSTTSNASAASSYTISSDTTYYGLYQRTLTLSYNANGGSSTPSSQTGTQYANSYSISTYTNPSFKLANAISKNGYTFSKWAVGSTSGKQYSAGANITISANTTMYAVWNYDLPKFTQNDRYSFSNSYDNFITSWSGGIYYMTQSDYNKLTSYIKKYDSSSSSTISRVQNLMYSSWGGSCYGMAATAVLDYQNKIGFNENFGSGAKTMWDVKSPSTDKNIMSAVNYYMVSQAIGFVRNSSLYYDKDYYPSSWTPGLKKLVSTAQKREPFLFCYYWTSGYNTYGHAIVAYDCKTNSDGSFSITAYDNRYPSKDVIIKVNSSYTSCVVNGNENAEAFEIYTDMSAFDKIDIDGPKNDMNINYNSYTYSSSNDEISVVADGNLTVTNAAGETISIVDGDIDSTMDIVSVHMIVSDTADGKPAPVEFVFEVGHSKSYYFESDNDNMEVSVKTNKIYGSATSENADSIAIGDDGVYVIGDNIKYSAALSSKNNGYDTVVLEGAAKRDVSLTYSGNDIIINGINGKDETISIFAHDSIKPDDYEIKEGYNRVKVVNENNTIDIKASSNNDGKYDISVLKNDGVKSVSVDDIIMNYDSSTKIKPVIDADSGVKYTVKYESSNPKVATVDKDGNVYGAKKGTAQIKVTVTDENNNTVTDTCKVTVKYSGLQWFIIIVLFGWIWYLK